ncbi:MAG: hypothetical protein IPN86_00935 [Saprospiraceae bacterium]|nr:hypothetical protein [Saprospiraceae bacterium]
MKNILKISLHVILFLMTSWISAKSNKTYHATESILASCVRPTASYDMKVNNVRARLYSGGNLFSDAQYITPSNNESPVSGIYAAGVWMGGVDRAKNIKFSGITYMSLGYDFFSGPLDINGTSDGDICRQWDKIFSVKGNNISQHIINYKKALSENQMLKCEDIPKDVLYWPAQGNPYFWEEFGWSLPDQPLAGYWDMNDDGIYDPCDGDYPYVFNYGCEEGYHFEYPIPSEINFFIFNDNAGPQTLSGPRSMQMEFQVNAFAYSTNDELNDMTFYNFKLINKANEDLIDCYFAWWVDPDLGCYQDDYIGCDPDLGMAYIYNEDAFDGNPENSCTGINSYGEKIPLIGFDFIQGPLVSKVFKKDENGNIVYTPKLDMNGDTVLVGDQILYEKVLSDPTPFTGDQDTLVEGQMSSFVYCEAGGLYDGPPATVTPQRGREDGFYNYIRGFWADGTPFTKGGSGYNPGSTDTTKYAFPDAPNDLTGWSMCTAGLPTSDKNMIMPVGPMVLYPGATKYLTMSIFSVFDVRYPCPDITKLKYVNGVAQSLFDGCFDRLPDGPDAPDLTGIGKDRNITIVLSNAKSSNNYNEKFQEALPNIPSVFDNNYKFEGYKIYQVSNQNVRFDQLNDSNYAKLIAQSDLKNEVSDIYNWRYVLNPDTTNGVDPYIWMPELKVTGKNYGLESVFFVNEDQFADTDKSLINGKEYYFCAVAYAHNNWRQFDNIERYGQKLAYLEGRSNFKIYKVIPKLNINNETPQLKVTRISGEGNPHTFLLMEDDMYGKILSPSFDGKIKYKTGYGPLQGKVIDQNKLTSGNIYRLEITGNFSSSANGNTCEYDDNAVWNLTDITNNAVLLEDKPLSYIKEYAVNELGFALTLHQHPEPGNLTYENNGGIGATVEYKNPNGLQWFNAVKDDGEIRSGFPKIRFYDHVRNGFNQDPSASLSKLGDGFFVPLLSTKFQNDENLPFFLSPAARDLMGYMTSAATNSLRYRDLNNVDIVFTSDKSKWSKCIVVETATNDYLDAGFTTIKAKEGDPVTKNFELRASPSKDENGNEIQNSIGFSYFPGYAINVETGKRLNIFFGENSVYSAANASLLDGNIPIGGDMIFNPSSQTVAEEFTLRNSTNGEVIGFTDVRGPVAGGQHYIYITRMEYDGCTEFAERLKRSTSGAGPSIINKAKVAAAITWTSFPILHPSLPMLSIQNGLIPNDLVVRLRVDNPYFESRKYTTARERACDTDGDHPVYEFGFDNDYISKVSNSESALDKIYVSPNPVGIHSSQMALHLYNLPEYAGGKTYKYPRKNKLGCQNFRWK